MTPLVRAVSHFSLLHYRCTTAALPLHFSLLHYCCTAVSYYCRTTVALLSPSAKKMCAEKTIHLTNETHTVGVPITRQLKKSPDVFFAGYKQVHPLIDNIEIHVVTIGDVTPEDVFNEGIDLLIADIDRMRKQFNNAVAAAGVRHS